jgi:phosphocarrier protein HPr
MKRSQFKVPWKQGLHLRPAAQLVRLANASRSSVMLAVGSRAANARSILAVMLLCATMGTVVNLEVAGEDEDAVLASIMRVFEASETE